MKRNLLILAVMVAVVFLFTPHNAGAQCPEDPNDLGECDTLYVETFDCDHEYDAGPGSFDSVRVAIYVTHDSNTFFSDVGGRWVQDSIAGFVIPLTFWHQPPGCADSVILPNWDSWNNTYIDPGHPLMNRSMFRHIVDTHTGETTYNRMLQMVENGKDAWLPIIDIEFHSSEGDSGHGFLALIPMGADCQKWWEGSRVLLATLTFHVYMSADCDTTEIGIDSTFWPPLNRLAFARYDAESYIPRHFLPVKDTIYLAPNEPPVVSDISDQTIMKDESFVPINLDDYVTDPDDPDDEITWTYWGNLDLLVDITDRAATITVPSPDWIGSETIWFKACDPGGLCDSNEATFTVLPKLAEVIAGEDQTGATKGEVSVMFYVQNIGSSTETYDLNITSSLGWDIEPQHLELTLNPSEIDSVSFTVSIPNVPLGTSDLVTLEAIPQSEPDAGDSDSLTVTCDYYTIKIVQIADVPNDQGKQVRIEWVSFTDFDSSVTFFTLFRRIDSLLLVSGTSVLDLVEISDWFALPDYPPGRWEVVGTIPAFGETLYATIVPTLKDSTIVEGMYYSVFFIRAGTDNPYIYFDSPVDSGYSLDNLLPSPPAGLFTSHEPAITKLVWSPTEALDFDYYTLYRDTLSGFTPGLSNRLGFTMDTTFLDSTAQLGRPYYYLATATDFSGNESETSNEAMGIRYIYITGDANADGQIDIADAVYLVNYFFIGGPVPEPLEAGDANCSGEVDLADAVYIVNWLFIGGPPPGC
jgi:hypothetical protein